MPLLRSPRDFEHGSPPDAIRRAQEVIGWADHIVIVFPLWLGTMPALLKGFLEQVLRPGFGTSRMEPGKLWAKRLTGKSARIIVTMGMPASVFRWYYGAHGVKVLERNVLGFCGISPVRRSLVGSAGGSAARRRKWLDSIDRLGRRGR
jgi:putative NADPH-quinone reductase